MSHVPGDTSSYLTNTTATSGTRSIYPKGPSFSLDTFVSKDFLVRDFVESLSDSVPVVSLRNSSPGSVYGGAFDPKPHIRSFEHALTRLSQLSEERESHENELAGTVRRAEGQHKQHCASLQRKLDQAFESFTSLESRLDSSLDRHAALVKGKRTGAQEGAVALEIGERLEELDRQKRRAEDAKFLIICWQEVSERGDLSHLEDIRRMGGSEGKVKCAQIARQLLRISHGLDEGATAGSATNGLKLTNGHVDVDGHGGKTEAANAAIEKFLESLETDLLDQFDTFQRQHNEDGMRDCATALYDFGEGASVIGRFVNQHDFFLERIHMVTQPLPEDTDLWERLADPDSDHPGLETSLQNLVDEVKLVLQEEAFTIKQVFPFHEQVLIKFVQRVFQQSIQQRLEILLETANSVSSLAFLRQLQAARNYIGSMVEDLKAHGLTEHPDTISPLASACLDQQFEDLFVPYSTGNSYIERERRSLEELYRSLLFKYTLYHSRRRKAPTTYLGALSQRGREMLQSARDSYLDRLNSTDIQASQKAMLMNISGIKETDSSKKGGDDIEVSEEDGSLSLPIAKRMFRWLAEAVGRGLELAGSIETPKDVSQLLRLLLVNVADIYLDTALDACLENASVQESAKTEPDLGFIPDAGAAISILQLTMTIANSVLLPLASSNVTVRREMEKSLGLTVSRMEDKISTFRMRVIDVILAWTSKLLARQNRTDFRQRDDLMNLDQLQTPTCTAIFAFMCRARDLCLKTVEGKNAEIFFTELAVGFRSLLLEHFKKFPVNLAGGLMVSKDITKYIELLKTFPLAVTFSQSLEVLVEVGNIFVIGPEALRERLRGGGALTGVDKADLRPYILRRDDAGSVGIQSVLNAL